MQSELHNIPPTTTLIDTLFDAGAHFGFSKSRRHPTVATYLYGSKQGTDIIDLSKTAECITNAGRVIHDVAKAGKSILIVGTKEEIVSVIRDCAIKSEVPYVINRWIGGTLTNFNEIRKRVHRLNDLLAQGVSGELERKYTKKERVLIGREVEKLTTNFSGIVSMEKLPGLLVVIDPRHDTIACREARDLNIPIVGVMSSDSKISEVTYPIVANDALQSSVRVILSSLLETYARGKSEHQNRRDEK